MGGEIPRKKMEAKSKTEERFPTWNYVKIPKRNENSTKLQLRNDYLKYLLYWSPA